MKIRISGPADLVDGWKEMLEAEYGQHGKIYPSRNSNDLRYYLDIDDRTAEQIMNRSEQSGSKQVRSK